MQIIETKRVVECRVHARAREGETKIEREIANSVDGEDDNVGGDKRWGNKRTTKVPESGKERRVFESFSSLFFSLLIFFFISCERRPNAFHFLEFFFRSLYFLSVVFIVACLLLLTSSISLSHLSKSEKNSQQKEAVSLIINNSNVNHFELLTSYSAIRLKTLASKSRRSFLSFRLILRHSLSFSIIIFCRCRTLHWETDTLRSKFWRCQKLYNIKRANEEKWWKKVKKQKDKKGKEGEKNLLIHKQEKCAWHLVVTIATGYNKLSTVNWNCFVSVERRPKYDTFTNEKKKHSVLLP